MKRNILTLIVLTLTMTVSGQDAKSLYEKGMTAVNEERLEDAIKYFDESIEVKNDEFIVWYNRGIAKSWLRKYEESIADFTQAIVLNPLYKKAFNSRANSKQDITDYEGALLDYNKAIQLDSEYIDALYNRGALYELLGNEQLACNDFNKTFQLGDKQSKRKVEKCNDTTQTTKKQHSILYLTKVSDNPKYGFTPELPIKVGTGPSGGPANQRAYLNLLRDMQGKPISYQRLGSCCAYESPNSMFGKAMVDKYQLKYLDESGKEKTAIVYISFYDYDEPNIVFGFKTVSRK